MKRTLTLFAILCMLTSFSQQAPTTWSIVASYTIPGKASGLAWDGTYIYFGIYGTNGEQIYKFNPSNGQYNLQCSGPFGDAYGLTYKSPNLVTINQPSGASTPAQALEFNMSGNQVSVLTLPNHYMSGIAYDNGDYWVCTYYPDPGTVYKVSSTGAILEQFTPPANQPWDICLQGNDLWIADYNANTLFKVNTAGSVMESHPCQNQKPSGIVYDGTYLWYCDGQLSANSTLYKVDLLGSGTPEITVPITSHNYGTVTVGSTSTWQCQVQNTGTANLVISAVSIPAGEPVSTYFVMPATVTPGNSVNIPLVYAPTVAGPLNTYATIVSNDPITPQVEVTLTGNAVVNGPAITVNQNTHDWGDRRAGAYSRWYLEITNTGNQPLEITDLQMSDNHFIVDESIILPLTIQTLQTGKIGIWFHPTEGIDYDGTLSIISNAVGQSPFDVSLLGTGVETLYPAGTLLWSYTPPPYYDTSPKSMIAGDDITGDGVPDVIIGSEDNFMRCLNGNSSGTADLMWEYEIPTGSVYQQHDMAMSGDINNDGFDDVIVGTAWGDRAITAFSGKTGQVIWKHDTHEYGGGGWVYEVNSDFDYNGDGFPDVLACAGDDGNDTGPLRVYCLNGKTGISLWETPLNGPGFAVKGVEDFTGDGIPDAVAGASNMNETEGRMFGINGSNGAIAWTQYAVGSSVWAVLQIDDINGDNIKDVATGDYIGRVFLHDAVNGTKLFNANIAGSLILRFEDLGDVNNDMHRDFIVGHSGTNAIVISGKDASTIWFQSMPDKVWNVASMGDITFDGKEDAIIGTLYQDNYCYMLNGTNGDEIFSGNTVNPVDAINSIPDIVGDNTREGLVGVRTGGVYCLSGGYDPSTDIRNQPEGFVGALSVFVSPNPITIDGRITVVTNLSGKLQLQVIDQYGRLIRQLANEDVIKGIFEFTWNAQTDNGQPVMPGVYFIQATVAAEQASAKAIVVK